jgi:hypothetical protein
LLSTEQVLTMLAATPPRIAMLTAALPPERLHTSPGEGQWSANDVLAHLRSCADMWGNAIATILAEDKPTFRAMNPVTWLKTTDYPKQEFRSSLRAFATQRRELLETLEYLPPAAWYRSATVTGAGKPLERTVIFYAQWLATHERPHIKQIERIVKTVRR